MPIDVAHELDLNRPNAPARRRQRGSGGASSSNPGKAKPKKSLVKLAKNAHFPTAFVRVRYPLEGGWVYGKCVESLPEKNAITVE
jgi:hypothetical protein